jgi:hypothetical protein
VTVHLTCSCRATSGDPSRTTADGFLSVEPDADRGAGGQAEDMRTAAAAIAT